MKLEECLIMGRFCGLTTLDECVTHAQIHYFPVLRADEAAAEYDELNRELSKYDNREIDIDWDYVNKELEKQLKELDKYIEENPPQDVNVFEKGYN